MHTEFVNVTAISLTKKYYALGNSTKANPPAIALKSTPTLEIFLFYSEVTKIRNVVMSFLWESDQ